MFEKLSEKQQETHFKRIFSKADNKSCADCKTKGASWVSMDFGVFICINCSGVHRSLGMHITRVRSTKLDSWTLADIKVMDIVGNKVANMYWEHDLIFNKKDTQFDDRNRAESIKRKYVMKLYIKKDIADPVKVVLDSQFSVKGKELEKLYLPSDRVKKAKAKKTVKKKFEFIKRSKVKTVEENVDFLDFTDIKENPSAKTKLPSKEDNSDLFDLDVDPTQSEKKSAEAEKPNCNNDLFFMDFTSNDKPHLRKSHSTNIDKYQHFSSPSNYFNAKDTSPVNMPDNNQVTTGLAFGKMKNDKYSVFDVCKLYNTPHHMY